MTLAHAAGDSHALSIGQVIAKLHGEFPDLTASKLRYLETEGIISPARTPSGYRKFSMRDVERLRVGLAMQRDVGISWERIRAQLDAQSDEELADAVPARLRPATQGYSRAQLLSEAAARPKLLDEAISIGLLDARERYRQQDLEVLQVLVALESHGLEPRHVRVVQQHAERDAQLVRAAIAPLLGKQDALSRSRAAERAGELRARVDDLRRALLTDAIARLLA